MHPQSTRNCLSCGEPFTPARPPQTYCTHRCFLSRPRPKRTLAVRAWEKVPSGIDPDACWKWQGTISAYGYGLLSVDRQNRFAHRVIWELTHGPIPDGMCVCHTCDVRDCVNPNHLWLGTNDENMHDMSMKGRASRQGHASPGESNPSAKLTEDQVREIRRKDAEGMNRPALAAEYGVRYDAIWRIVTRRDWVHI